MKWILAIAVIVVLGTIATGMYLLNREKEGFEQSRFRKSLRTNLSVFIPLVLISILILIPDVVFAAEEEGATSASAMGFMAAALSTGLAALGAGYAVGAVGSSALGAVSEDPKILGKTLIFVGLAEGIAIYGLIISIMILGRI